MVGFGRLGVAFVATAAVALGQALPASAQEAAPPSPAETSPAETTAVPDAPPPAPSPDTSTQSAPADPAPTPAPKEPDAPPAADTKPADTAPAPESTPSNGTPSSGTPSSGTPAESAPTGSEPAATPKDAVKLEPAAPAAAPAAAAPAAAPQPAAAAQSAPPATTVILVQVEPADAAEPSEAANAEAASEATALIVTFRPRAGISLLETDEPAVTTAVTTIRSIRKARAIGKQLVQKTCVRPTARVPLSQRCVEARAFAVLRATFTSSPSPEVRAAIDRVAARETVRRVEARPPPESKAAKKHTVAEVRPTIPFGSSGQGVANDGFSGSPGSTSSSRLFALAAVPLRVPLPFRFARVRVPSTRPHGVIAAPPTARPG